MSCSKMHFGCTAAFGTASVGLLCYIPCDIHRRSRMGFVYPYIHALYTIGSNYKDYGDRLNSSVFEERLVASIIGMLIIAVYTFSQHNTSLALSRKL